MSETFQVGEIALWINRFGITEVEIVAGPAVLPHRDPSESINRSAMGYYIRIPGATWFNLAGTGICFSLPERLRKKPGERKREEIGSWDLCPWQPKEVTV